MHKRSVQIAAMTAALGMVLALFSAGADAATKKKKKKHHYRHGYSQTYKPTPSEYNYCRYRQTLYPTLDIRC